MPAPLQSQSLLAGDNRLVSGTQRKSWNSNARLISKLIFAEVIQTASPSLAVLPAVYRVGLTISVAAGENAFWAGLSPQIDIFLLGLGLPPAGIAISKFLINNIGVPDMVNGIESGSSGFMAPKPGYLFALKEKDLNIPSGEFSIGSVWRSGGATYILEAKSQWFPNSDILSAENIDFIGFVPNFSWLGTWYPYSGPIGPSSSSPSTSRAPGGSLLPPSDELINGEDKKSFGLAPLVIAGILAKLFIL